MAHVGLNQQMLKGDLRVVLHPNLGFYQEGDQTKPSKSHLNFPIDQPSEVTFVAQHGVHSIIYCVHTWGKSSKLSLSELQHFSPVVSACVSQAKKNTASLYKNF